MKRVFSFLLVLLLVVGLVPVQTQAISLYDILVIPFLNGYPAEDILVEHSISGNTVTLSCSGYLITEGVLYSGDGGAPVGSFTGSSFTFPADYPSVEVMVNLIPVDTTMYKITVMPSDHGSVTPTPTSATAGIPISVTAQSAEGYELTNLWYEIPNSDYDVMIFSTDPNMYASSMSFDMPAADINLYATFEKTGNGDDEPDPAPHKVNLTVLGEGDVEISHTEATAGEHVTVTKADPRNQGDEVYISFTNVDGNPIMDRDANSFTMPDYDAYVTVSFRKHYQIETEVAPDASAGTVTPSKPSATEGESITVTAEPNDTDHKLGKITVSYGETNLDITESKTFTMPASDVKIYAEFQAKQPYDITPEITGGQGSISFTVNEVTTTTAKEGQVVAVEAVPAEGYMAQPITAKETVSGETIEVKDGKFTMHDCAVTVSTSFVKAVTVTFNYNEGTNVDNVASVIIPAGNSLSALPNTSRADHKLVGWYLPNGTKVDAKTSFADDTTITARWVYAKHTTKQKGNDFEADLAMENADVLDQLLDYEDLSAALKDGLNVYVYMKVKNKTEADVPSVDKTAIAVKAGSAKIAAYLDITLWKQIGEDDSKASKITNTGDEVPITMKLDAGIIPANAGSVYIVYYHGEAKEIRNVSYNHATRELTFPAREFSTYSLVYTPYVAPAAAPASSNTYVLDNVPKTGEGSALMNWTLLVLCSAAMLAAVAILDKKRAR